MPRPKVAKNKLDEIMEAAGVTGEAAERMRNANDGTVAAPTPRPHGPGAPMKRVGI